MTRHLYDGRHGLLEVRDPRGIRAIKNEYDAGGRLIATEHPDGHRITYTQSLAARQELIRDRMGNPTLYEYDDEGNSPANRSSGYPLRVR